MTKDPTLETSPIMFSRRCTAVVSTSLKSCQINANSITGQQASAETEEAPIRQSDFCVSLQNALCRLVFQAQRPELCMHAVHVLHKPKARLNAEEHGLATNGALRAIFELTCAKELCRSNALLPALSRSQTRPMRLN
jgi:hypothetical protein